MNSSIYSADRATHQRIIAMTLFVSLALVGFAISARVSSIGTMQATARPGAAQKAEVPSPETTAVRPVAHRT